MTTGTRDRILAALREVLAGGGTDAATLENVAARAGVSKGGLLYHFPSKQDLFHGLLAQTQDSVAAELGGLTSQDDVVRTFLEYSAPRDEQERGFIAALITGIRNEDRAASDGPSAGADFEAAHTDVDSDTRTHGDTNSDVRTHGDTNSDVRTHGDTNYRVSSLFADIFAAWEEPIRSAVDDPVTAEIILQVGNGMYLAAVCGLPAPDPDITRALVDRLVEAAHRTPHVAADQPRCHTRT